jgi:hypothetical protein
MLRWVLVYSGFQRILTGVVVNNRQLRQTALVTADSNPYILDIIWQCGQSVVFFLSNVCLL